MDDNLKKMLNLAKQVIKNAYVPCSHFSVGTCIRTTDDEYFVGCNCENTSWPLSFCAETSAIAQMISSGRRTILDVLIISNKKKMCFPCGGCRQNLAEFSNEQTKVHVMDENNVIKTFLLSELLPNCFKMSK